MGLRERLAEECRGRAELEAAHQVRLCAGLSSRVQRRGWSGGAARLELQLDCKAW